MSEVNKDELHEKMQTEGQKVMDAMKVARDALGHFLEAVPAFIDKLDGNPCECEAEMLNDIAHSLTALMDVNDTYMDKFGHLMNGVIGHDASQEMQSHMEGMAETIREQIESRLAEGVVVPPLEKPEAKLN